MSSNAPSSSAPVNRRLGRVSPRRTVGLGVLAFTLILSACGSEQSLGGKVAKDGGGCTISSVDRRTDVPVPKATSAGKKTSTIVQTKAKKTACAAESGKLQRFDMVGAHAKNGKVFTSTWDVGRPLTTQLGGGKLLKGLETGLAGMKVGERRQITIPAAEAYGKEGYAPQGIGANEDLVFIADLVGVGDVLESCNAMTTVPKGTRAGKPTEVKMPETPPTKVKTTVLKPGDGPKATKTSYLTVDYVGVSCTSGQQFDSSWDRADPITMAMAKAKPTASAFSVIPGWTTGLLGQKQGSTVQIDIPADQAYGAQPPSAEIAPNDPLTFIVKILKVSAKPPPEPKTTTTTAPAGATTTAPAGTTTTAAGK